MTVVSVRKSEIKKIIGNKLDSEIDHVLSMMSTAVERMDKNNVEVEVAPNRPDMLSESGILRALKSFSGKSKGLHKININAPKKDYDVFVEPSVKDIRPYTVCAIVRDLKFDDNKIKEIIDIQEKLHNTLGRKRKKLAIGVYPLDKIKLPIRFSALDPDKIKFQPLEFQRELTGRQILSQHHAGREYGNLLEGKNKYPVFIDANNEVLSMPPIINSHRTGKIENKTKDIFIECSGFDLEVQKKTINIITSALADMGGKVYQVNVHYGSKILKTPDFSPEKMKLSVENANKLLGLELNSKEISNLLGKMGLGFNGKEVLIPAYRTDIMHEVDLIEDIAIAYGYDNLVPVIPEISTIGEISKEEIIKSKIRELLIGLNLIETSSFHLTTKDYQINKFGLKDTNERYVEVENSKTEYNLLRKDLSHYLLRILSENVDVEYPQEIFQIGTIFSGNSGVEEKTNLSIALAPGNFTRLKQILEYLGKMLDVKIEILKTNNFEPYFIDGRVAEIKINNKMAGYFGEVHPRILKNFKVKMPVSLVEINLEELFNI